MKVYKPLKGTSYDGIYYAKVSITRPVIMSTSAGEGNKGGDMVISWGNAIVATTNLTSIVACAEFNTLSGVFD